MTGRARMRYRGQRIRWTFVMCAHVCAGIGLVSGTSHLFAQSSEGAATDTRNPVVAQSERPDTLLRRRFDIDVREVAVEMAVQEIRRKSGVNISHSKDVFQPGKRVTLQAKQITVADALERILKGTNVVVQISPSGMIYLARKGQPRDTAKDSTGTITGRVVDSATGAPISGVSVTRSGTGQVAVTDAGGQFVLAGVPAGTHTLTFRLLGYISATRTVNAESNQRAVLRVQLRQSANLLSGVVTTATGKQRKLEVGNDVTTLNVDSIMKTAPIASVTDLLESRVPGMTIQRTSGTPGDPARIRLRGTSSIYANNDPIIIVDGIRMYSEQSETRNINTTGLESTGRPRQYATPSPLDQIDPNVIETLEVLKGPSASALYGSDAANGVIVITTKRGRAGPAQWGLSASAGRSAMSVSRWPESEYPWATPLMGGPPVLCFSIGWCGDMHIDSVVRFQALNDPRLTALGTGSTLGGAVSVSGGNQNIQYSLTGSGSAEQGLLKLPDVEAERYTRFQGKSVPGWMRRPDHLQRRNANATMQIQVTPRINIGVQTTLSQQTQERTSMSSSFGSAIGVLQSIWVDRSQLGRNPLLGNPYERVRSSNINLVTAVQLGAQIWNGIPISATFGMNTLTQNNESSIASGLVTGAESGGVWRGGTNVASGITGTAFVRDVPLLLGVTLAAGMNYDRGQTNDQLGALFGIPVDVSDPSIGQDTLMNQFQRSTSDRRSFGWFLEPKLNVNSRFFMMPGFRLDNNGLAGSKAGLNWLPKMNFSWIASEERFFPFRHIVNQFRVRSAFGVSGVQPKLADATRLYSRIDGNYLSSLEPLYGELLRLSSLGNTKLRPERGVEIEGGFDAELWNNRLGIQFTHYRKRRVDAILDNKYAISVGGGGDSKMNIGDIDNSGTEIELKTQLVERQMLGINLGVNLTRYRSNVVRLNPTGKDFMGNGTGVGYGNQQYYVVGYPMEAVWSRPIIGYADVNGNGSLENNEVVIADDHIFAGSYEPAFQAALHPGVTMFGGRANFAAVLSYVGRRTQEMDTPYEFTNFGVGISPSSDLNGEKERLARQAIVMAASGAVSPWNTNIGFLQEVKVFRLQSVSAQFTLGTNIVRILRARSASVLLQGSNIGIWTNYRGVDPNVNAMLGGHGSMDLGQLPQPRTWQLSLRMGY